MRLAWFTPFARQSAIGRYSQAILRPLSLVADVDLWLPSKEDTLDTPVRIVEYGTPAQISDGVLASYDLVVYNFGNYLPYHRDIYEISLRVPGLAILHDVVLHHFFAALYLEALGNPDGYRKLLHKHYGESAMHFTPSDKVWETDEVVNFPLFEQAIGNAYGVVTHSEFFRQKVDLVFPGPVRKIPLPYDQEAVSSPVPKPDIPADQVLLLTVGHVNPNKRVHTILRALGECRELAGRWKYAVLGPYQEAYYCELQEIVEQYSLEKSVQFLGYGPDDQLRGYLERADICVNLRFPAFEGASASVAEALLHGKPVIVSRTGSYEEIPDDCVAKIDPGNELESLKDIIRTLVPDRAAREAYGQAALRHAHHYHRAEYFVKEFLPFAEEVRSAKPLLQCLDRAASLMRAMNIDPPMPVVAEFARLAAELFAKQQTAGTPLSGSRPFAPDP